MRRGDTIVSKYRLNRQIGAGGMGVVWEARHLVTGRPFAIKFLVGPSREEHYARFHQEAKVSGLVRHPSIVDIYDVGTAPELGGLPFLVLDLLDGLSLRELLAMGKLSVPQALAFIVPIAGAVEAAHEAGVIHRDLKPSNLYLHRLPTGALVPKVLDFGISKLVGPARQTDSEGRERRRLTRTGALLGSPLYMSPEQVRGDTTLDARSDIHALGAILWECLAGRPLFPDDLDDHELAACIASGPRRPLSEVWSQCPPMLSELIARCVAVAREDRFGSAAELRLALERVQTELAPDASLADPNEARELYPVMSQAKIPKPFEHATTVDSDMPAGSTDREAGPPGGSAQGRSRSIEGWGDKRPATSSQREPRARWRTAALAAFGVFAFVGAAILGQRFSHKAPAAAAAASISVVDPPPPSVAPVQPPIPSDLVASAGLGTPPVQPLPPSTMAAAEQVTARRAPATASPPARTSSGHAAAPSKPHTEVADAGAAEPLGTSANGAPIIR